MDIPVFEKLQKEGLLSTEVLEQIKVHEKNRHISVQWDLRTLLYLSILMVSAGLGIVLYKNIDTIGHATLVTLTGLLAGSCFFYCFKKSAPFSRLQVASPDFWFDYILLLGCLLMLAFVGYLQYQYHVFGMRWGLAIFIPMVFLFLFAYYFDHIGVLSLAITNLGAWMGIAVAPMKLLRSLEDSDENIIINGVILGSLLHLFAWLTTYINIKKHFAIVYKNFGLHVLFISLIWATGSFDNYFWWFLALAAVSFYHIRKAIAARNFYFLVASVLYGYFGVSIVVVKLLANVHSNGDLEILLGSIYFIGSGIELVFLLISLNKKFNKQ